MAVSQKEQIKVRGYLRDKRGIYQLELTWFENSVRKRKSISSKLPVKGNKKRAEEMLKKAQTEQEKFLLRKQEQKLTESERFSNKSKMFFSDFLIEWLKEAKREYKPTTYGAVEVNIRKIIAPYFKEKCLLIQEVTPEHIKDFYDSELARGLKATSVHKYQNSISKAFKYAIELGIIDTSPMDKVKRPRADRYAAKFLNETEIIELFEAVKGNKLELGVILAGYYGLRRGEVVGLRWEAIDFNHNTITIDHTVTVAHVEGKKQFIVSDTAKTNSSLRTLPLVPAFREKLLNIRKEYKAKQKLAGSKFTTEDSEYIYLDEFGKRLKPDYLTQQFAVFMERNGFKKIRFHDLRHSAASLLLANGVHLKQIQEWLGHSSFKITADAYAHLEYKSKVAAANAMTWINKASLSSNIVCKENPEIQKDNINTRIESLIASGISSDDILKLLVNAEKKT